MISWNRQTDGHTHTHEKTTVTLAAHAHRGLIKKLNMDTVSNCATTMSNSGSDLWGKTTDITYVIVFNNSTHSIGQRLRLRPGKNHN